MPGSGMTDIDATIGNGHRENSAARPRGLDRRRALIVSTLFLSGLGVLALTVTWATSASVHAPSVATLFGLDGRIARVVATHNGRCRQFAFDNDSAAVSQLSAPCSTDEPEVVRRGTARRLDAVSRSFLGRD